MRWPALTLLVLFSGWASAHPVDKVVQGAYLTLAPGEVRLELDLTPGTKVANTLLQPLDADADQHITDAEARAFALQVIGQSTLKLDGMAAAWTLDEVSVPPYQYLRRESGTLKIYAVADRRDGAGAHALSYQNIYQPAKSQWTANVFLQPGAGRQYQVTGQQRSNDGRKLTVSYIVTEP